MKREPGNRPDRGNTFSRAATVPIRAYSRFISPGLPRRCKYEPTCSAYALEAVGRFGVLRGLLLAAWRILRCNPFSHGGFDPVRDEFTLQVGPVDPAIYHGEVSEVREAPRKAGEGPFGTAESMR